MELRVVRPVMVVVTGGVPSSVMTGEKLVSVTLTTLGRVSGDSHPPYPEREYLVSVMVCVFVGTVKVYPQKLYATAVLKDRQAVPSKAASLLQEARTCRGKCLPFASTEATQQSRATSDWRAILEIQKRA